MALTDYVIMPSADYTAACDKVRERTGKTDPIKSGDLAAEIEAIPSGGGGETENVLDLMADGRLGGDIVLETATKIREMFAYDCKGVTSVRAPNATKILNNAFYIFNTGGSLKSVYAPKCTYVGEYAFAYQMKLTDLTLGTVGNSVSKGAFQYCPLPDISFAKHCTSLGNDCFAGCAATSAEFNNATTIGSYALSNSRELRTFSAQKITAISSNCFSYCSKLETVSAPLVQTVGSYAFSMCTALKQIVLPVGRVLSVCAFEKCTSLELVDLQNTVASAFSVDSSAFTNCSSLKALILRNNNAYNYSLKAVSAFTGTPIASGTGFIYVPRGRIDSYKTATNWSTYSAQFRALEDYTVDGTNTGALDYAKMGLDVPTYTVTHNAPNCTFVNVPETINYGGKIEGLIEANAGYNFDTIKVTMGGVDITDTAILLQNNEAQFGIPSVTGDVVITITTVEA